MIWSKTKILIKSRLFKCNSIFLNRKESIGIDNFHLLIANNVLVMTTAFQCYLIIFELTMNFTHRYEKCFLISYVTLGGNKVHIFIKIFLSIRLYEEKCVYRLNDAWYVCLHQFLFLFVHLSSQFYRNKTKRYATNFMEKTLPR